MRSAMRTACYPAFAFAQVTIRKWSKTPRDAVGAMDAELECMHTRSMPLLTIWTVLAALMSGCFTPLQVAGGGDWSRANVRPRAEARLSIVEVLSSDTHTHQAIWLGATSVVTITTNRGAEVLLGPELQFSRGRDVRGLSPSVDVLYFRPEFGTRVDDPEAKLSFWGASLGAIRQFGNIPLTAALRVGDNVRGPESGLSVGLTIGIVIGSSLYWMQ
jgi:hypothetical protein